MLRSRSTSSVVSTDTQPGPAPGEQPDSPVQQTGRQEKGRQGGRGRVGKCIQVGHFTESWDQRLPVQSKPHIGTIEELSHSLPAPLPQHLATSRVSFRSCTSLAKTACCCCSFACTCLAISSFCHLPETLCEIPLVPCSGCLHPPPQPNRNSLGSYSSLLWVSRQSNSSFMARSWVQWAC